MGVTIRDVVFDIGGGIPKDRKFKAVQMGGPSGGCIPEKFLDLPVDYDSLQSVGAIMGSGGMVVMDENTCMVEVARVLSLLHSRGVLWAVFALPHRHSPNAANLDVNHPG